MEGWICVYSSNKPHEIEYLKVLLAENSIKAVEVNKLDSAYLFGDIELYVSAEDAFNAKQLISNLESE